MTPQVNSYVPKVNNRVFGAGKENMSISSKGRAVAAICFLLFLVCLPGRAETSDNRTIPRGTIKGSVVDGATQAPLPAASVMLVGTSSGTRTDDGGMFCLANIPVGNYSLRISCLGYRTNMRADVIVRPDRITFVKSAMVISAVKTNDVVVNAGYFPVVETEPTSRTHFSSEVIRRAPGAAGDISRIVGILPSVARSDDLLNGLIVRGGCSAENGFYVDNIEVPNINHFPLPGSTGGLIGLINVNFIEDVNFSAGGFSTAYGDRLSSVMDISLREGNRDEYDGQVSLSMAGLRGAIEGPVSRGKGSWMFAANRSFLELLVDALDIGIAPAFSDYQGKLYYDITPSNRLTMLGLLGYDAIDFDRAQAQEDGNAVYGAFDVVEATVGANWRKIWNASAYTNAAFSYLSTRYDGTVYDTSDDFVSIKNKSLSRTYQVRTNTYYRINQRHKMEAGFDARFLVDNYDDFSGRTYDDYGIYRPAMTYIDHIETFKGGAYVSYTVSPLSRLTTTFGLRYDHFAYNRRSHFSPRFSFSQGIGNRLSFNGATGIYYQTLPLAIRVSRELFQRLEDVVAYHYVLGIKYLVTENTQISVEGYLKDYDHFPIDPRQPTRAMVDDITSGDFSGFVQNLVSDGKAKSYGIEFLLQKKLAQDIYGLIGGTVFKTRYRDLEETWHDRRFDNRYIVTVEGGYKPNNTWEFSLRWVLAGGTPYTPLNVEWSQAYNQTIYDVDHVNEERYPDYHSLNIRFDRHFNFQHSSMILYFSIWNVYNRRNISYYFWDEVRREVDTLYQLGILPIVGLEYAF